MWSFVKSHWKFIAGVACGAGTAALAITPAAPLAWVTGTICSALLGGHAYELGHAAGVAATKGDIAELVKQAVQVAVDAKK